MRLSYGHVLAFWILGCAVGCASHNDRARAYLRPFADGDWTRAALAAGAVAADGRRASLVLDHLELGTTQLVAGDLERSDRAFAVAWTRIKQLGGPDNRKMVDALAAVALNDRVQPYLATSYDRVMCTTYQAIDALGRGDHITARVMLKRAQFAQEDAEARFQKQIDEAAATVSREHGDVGRVEGSSRYAREYEDLYGTLDARFKPYEGWTNPFTDWLTAIVLLGLDETSSDRNRAIDLLRRVRGTIGPNATVATDIALAEAGPVTGIVWVVLESGFAPKRIERTFEIPAFMSRMPYIGLALPELVAVPGGATSFTVGDAQSSMVCDLGSIISHEFKAQLPLITRRAIASTIAKGAATLAANLAAEESGKDWAKLLAILGGNIYGRLTLAADLRSWRTLPARILIARTTIPADRRIRIGGLGGIERIDLIDGEVVLVHLRSIDANGPVAVLQAALRTAS